MSLTPGKKVGETFLIIFNMKYMVLYWPRKSPLASRIN